MLKNISCFKGHIDLGFLRLIMNEALFLFGIENNKPSILYQRLFNMVRLLEGVIVSPFYITPVINASTKQTKGRVRYILYSSATWLYEGSRAIIAENLLLKQQLIVHRRTRQRAPNLSVWDRGLFGFWTLFLSPRRIARSAIIIKPSTLLRFHTALKNRKYQLLFSTGSGKPGPKGQSKEVIHAIVEMKKRNPRFGCPRIAQQINLAFGLNLDKDIVRRILAIHYRPDPSSKDPSWLTTLGHAKDSLWSVDLFRCESIVLMVQHSVGCSTSLLPNKAGQNISAQIIIHCFSITNGKPIYE